MSAETLTPPTTSSSPESALAADIGGVVAVLRELVTNIDNPTALGELPPLLAKHASVLAARAADLGDSAQSLDGDALADRARRYMPPEWRALVGKPCLEGDML